MIPHSDVVGWLIISGVDGVLQRISIADIKNHPWFLRNLPRDLVDASYSQGDYANDVGQSVDDIMRIVDEARLPGTAVSGNLEDVPVDGEELDFDPEAGSSGDFVCAM